MTAITYTWIGFGSIIFALILLVIDPSQYIAYTPLFIGGIISLREAARMSSQQETAESIVKRLENLDDELVGILKEMNAFEAVNWISEREQLPTSLFFSHILLRYALNLNLSLQDAIQSHDTSRTKDLLRLIENLSIPFCELPSNYKQEIISLDISKNVVFSSETMCCKVVNENSERTKYGYMFMTLQSIIFIATKVNLDFLQKHYLFGRIMDRTGLDVFADLATSLRRTALQTHEDKENDDGLQLDSLLNAFEEFKVYIPYEAITMIDLGTSTKRRLLDPKVKISWSDTQYCEFHDTNNGHDFLESMEYFLRGMTTMNNNPLIASNNAAEYMLRSYYNSSG